MSEEKLTKQECIDILALYRDWNTSQQGLASCCGGKRDSESDLLDARRELITSATNRLTELST